MKNMTLKMHLVEERIWDNTTYRKIVYAYVPSYHPDDLTFCVLYSLHVAARPTGG